MNIKNLCALVIIVVLLLSGKATGEVTDSQKKPRLDMWISILLPYDSTNPRVKVTYSHVGGDKPIVLRLPAQDGIVAFREVDIIIDGKRPVYQKDFGGIFILFSRRVNLPPGKSVDLIIPLKKIVKLPKSWQRLEVTPKQFHRLTGTKGGIIIVRPEKG